MQAQYQDLNEDMVQRDQRIYNLTAGQPTGSKIFVGGKVVIVGDRVKPFIWTYLCTKPLSIFQEM